MTNTASTLLLSGGYEFFNKMYTKLSFIMSEFEAAYVIISSARVAAFTNNVEVLVRGVATQTEAFHLKAFQKQLT